MKPRLLSPLLLVLIFSFVVVLLVTKFEEQTTVEATISDPTRHYGGSISENVTLNLDAFAQGLNRPVGITSAGDIRLFVVEQAGRIKIVQQDGTVQSTPFLDIRGRVDSSQSEEGLLGLAFHPQYHRSGLFYVNYTNTSDGIRRTRISSFRVSADPNIADPKSENILLTVDQPNWNHNAGKIVFGPDGYLYIPLGDGGGDPGDNAQHSGRLLGKISRIDVNNGPGSAADCQGLFGSGEYTIPVSNPLLDGPGGACDEIWALGLRNPWQSSFDSLTGDLFVADVGQSKVEEVNVQPAISAGGENYGWPCYEGNVPYPDTEGCGSAGDYTFPVFQYERPSVYGDCSVTGGYVYRGQRYPALYGRYFLTDYCSGRFWDLLQLPDESWQSTEHNDVEWPGPGGGSLGVGNSAFGQRCDGELFVANVIRGELYHLTSLVSPDAVSPDAVTADYESAQTDWITSITADSYIYLPLLATSNCR